MIYITEKERVCIRQKWGAHPIPNTADDPTLRLARCCVEQNDERQTASRYLMAEAFAQIDKAKIPNSPYNQKSCLIMCSGHPGNYTTLTGVTLSWSKMAPVSHAGQSRSKNDLSRS